MRKPASSGWRIIAIQTHSSQEWDRAPGAKMSVDEARSKQIAGHIELRTRPDALGHVMEVREKDG